MDENLENELRRTLRALAQPADVQRSLFPEEVVIGDELVMEFCDAFERCRSVASLPDAQLKCLTALDELIDSHSGEHNEDLWCDPESLSTDPRWEDMRQAAARALDSFGWTNVAPEKNDATYVFADRVETNS